MKRKGLLFSILSAMCVGLTAGCGSDEPTYAINAKSSSNEQGYITGGGKYKKEADVSLKVYANLNCRASSLEFIKKGETTGREVNFTSVTDEYSEYLFTVDDDTIGDYVANFACVEVTPENDNERVAKYVITYKLVINNEEKVFIDNTGNDNGLENNQEKIDSGKKITPKYYIDGIEGKVLWYTVDPTSQDFNPETHKYNFNDAVTKSLTLYGKVADISDEQAVTDALDNYKAHDKMQVIIGDEKATILDFKKALEDVKDINMKVATADGNTKYIIQNNVYYHYKDSSTISGLDLYSDENKSGFKLQDIKDAYKFVELKDLVISNYDVVKKEVAETERDLEIKVFEGGKEVSKTVKCNIYELKEKNTENVVMTLYIYQDEIYKVVKGSVESVFVYNDNLATTKPQNAKDMYLVRVYAGTDSSNEEFKEEINEINNDFAEINDDFEKVIKIVPSYGESLKETLENSEIKDILKKYDYKWTKYKNGECTDEEYSFASIVNGDISVCAWVNTGLDSVKAAIDNLKYGGINISTIINIQGFGNIAAREYLVAPGVNALELVKSDVVDLNENSKMHPKAYETLQKIKSLLSEYNRYEYEDDVYRFYAQKNDSVAYLSIILENNKLKAVIFYDGENTYTSTFEYPTNPDVGTVVDSVNNVITNIETGYYDKAEGYDVNAITDAEFYTEVGYVYGDVSSITINGEQYSSDVVKFSVGNNNFINRAVWKIKDNKLYVSSLILKSHMLLATDGKIIIDMGIDTIKMDVTGYVAPTIANNVSVINGTLTGESGEYAYSATTGLGQILIEIGDVNATALAIVDRDGVVSYAFSKFRKIGDKYYLVVYPNYKNGDYVAEDVKEYTLKVSFITDNGVAGIYTFDVKLEVPEPSIDETVVSAEEIVDSVNTNINVIKEKYYNKETGFEFDEVADEEFYTLIADVSNMEITSITGVPSIEGNVKFSVGNNNFIEKPIWKVVDGKLYISSLALKSSMNAGAVNGLTEIEIVVEGTAISNSALIYEKEIVLPTGVENLTLFEDNVSVSDGATLESLTGSEFEGLDAYRYEATNGLETIMIELGDADADVICAQNKNGTVSYAFSRLDKIGDKYYLIIYPQYKNGDYTAGEACQIEYTIIFSTSDGRMGTYYFEVNLKVPVTE